MDGFVDRVEQALAGRPMSWLAKETGISTSMLSEYRKGKTPGADKAVAIANVLKADLRWLLTGEGEPSSTMANGGNSYSQSLQPDHADDAVEVAEVDLRYGMGGTFLDTPAESETRTFSRAWLRNFTDTPPEELFWAKGQGNSMAPTIEDGDVILIDRSQRSPRIEDLIWAFAWGEIGAIKRLRPLPNGSVRILSDNTLVPPETAHADELHIIGRVVARLGRL